MRKHRAGGQVVEFPGGADAGSLVDAVRDALDEAGTSETWEGRNAVLLAERLVAAERESGSAIAALAAKLESSMQLALRPRPGESFGDELRKKRLERLGG